MAEHDVHRHLVGVGGKGRLGQPFGHAGADEAGLHADSRQPRRAELVVEPFEVRRQTGLAGAVEHHWLAPALSCHGTEHAQRAAAAPQQVAAQVLAEEHRVGEVHCEEALREGEVPLQRGLGREQSGGDDRRVEPAQGGRRGVHRRGKRLRPLQIARRIGHGSRRRHARLQVGGARCEVGTVAPEQVHPVAACRQPAGQGPTDPLRSTQQHNLQRHLHQPNSRTDCALRMRPSGSQVRRTARKRSRRVSIARKCSGRVSASFAR